MVTKYLHYFYKSQNREGGGGRQESVSEPVSFIVSTCGLTLTEYMPIHKENLYIHPL